MRFIFKILSSVLGTIHVDPLSESVPLPVFEYTLIVVAIGPCELALAIWHTVYEFANVFESAFKSDNFAAGSASCTT